MKGRQLLFVVAAALCAARPARAQSSLQTSDSSTVNTSSSSSAEHLARTSSIDRPSDAVRRSTVVAAAPLPASGKQLGEAKAEMIVGGAAVVVGALIGGDGGSVLMFGGAIVGLYGLWNYLK